jgi:type I restriction enzyme, S subunit
MFGDPQKNEKNWPTRKLGELSQIRRGASPRPIDEYLGGIVPWIRIGDADRFDDLYITSTKDNVTDEGCKKSVFLKKGSLIFANCGVSLGFARLLKIDGCIHDGWLSIEKVEGIIHPIFLLKVLNQSTTYFRGLAPEGTQPNLNTEIMKDYDLIIPPLDLQRNYIDIVQAFGKVKNQQIESERQAEELFQGLLGRAFAGEV